jgi:hypothetical protein
MKDGPTRSDKALLRAIGWGEGREPTDREDERLIRRGLMTRITKGSSSFVRAQYKLTDKGMEAFHAELVEHRRKLKRVGQGKRTWRSSSSKGESSDHRQ